MKALLDGLDTALVGTKSRRTHRDAADKSGFHAVLAKAGGKEASRAKVLDRSQHRPDDASPSRLRLPAPHDRNPKNDNVAAAAADFAAEDRLRDDETAQPAGKPPVLAAGMLAVLIAAPPAALLLPAAPAERKAGSETAADEPGAHRRGEAAAALPDSADQMAKQHLDKPEHRMVARQPTFDSGPASSDGREPFHLPVVSAEARSLPAPALATPSATIASLANGVADAIAAQPAQGAAPASPRLHVAPAAGPMHSLKIQLHPAELGAVTARLNMRGDGVEVHLQVETAKAYRELSDDAEAITRALQAIGLRVDSVTVQAPAPSPSPDRTDLGQSGGNAFTQPDGARGEGGARGRNDKSPGGFADELAPYVRDRAAGEGGASRGGLYI